MPDENLSMTEVTAAVTTTVTTTRPTSLSECERTPGGAKPDPILVAQGVRRSFGGLTAVDVERVEVQRGIITALIGPNGAGKTTFFNLLTGFDRPDAGTWALNDVELAGLAAHKVARKGMVRTFQLTKALSKLTVLENMRLGAIGQRGERLRMAPLRFLWREQEDAVTVRAHELLARFKLDSKAGDFAGSLSGGQRKLLEMARALMAEPELVMLDEPMAGVNPALTQSLLGHVKDLREQGTSVLFVEHDMDMVRDISDWVIVMAQGKIAAEGPPDEVMADPAVIDAYLGSHHDAPLNIEDEQHQLDELAASVADELDLDAEERAAVDEAAATHEAPGGTS